MADTKLADLASGAPAAATDLVYAVKDPSGTPTDAKLTLGEVKTLVVGAGSVSVASTKTLTASNTLTLAGTDGTTMTFPSTSATLARTDAANTFTGNQTLESSNQLLWSTDLILTRRGERNLRFGAADAATALAQTLSVQSVVAGTTNTAGANLTITGSQGTGDKAGGSIIFQVAPSGGSGTAQNAFSTALTIQAGFGTFGERYAAFTGRASAPEWMCLSGSNKQVTLKGDGLYLSNIGQIAFTGSANAETSLDLYLLRDAANTLAQRNGANAQAFRVYNTFTDATTFERANIRWSSNVLQIGTEKGSVGGTARTLELQTDGTTRLTIAATTGNVTTTGSVTTEAPTGGTAAAWRLGTVASVTPTLQNRTIEVDIGGTIYYISAKTTND